MLFGTKVWVERGSAGRPVGTPGCLRLVKGTLVGARGHERYVRLEEDDPFDSVGAWIKAGDVGNWSASVVKKREDASSLSSQLPARPKGDGWYFSRGEWKKEPRPKGKGWSWDWNSWQRIVVDPDHPCNCCGSIEFVKSTGSCWTYCARCKAV